MKFNFKRIASVLTGAVMLSSTVALAAAAANQFPEPFVKSGSADVAVVYGSAVPPTSSDISAALNIGTKLQNYVTAASISPSASTSQNVSGETALLFTGSSKVYVNNTLNSVKNVLTKTELPTVLKDGTFSGNVDATYTQTIVLGVNPQVIFGKQPTSDDDPDFVLSESTSTATPIYNATITFNKAINLTHADSKGAELNLFGQKFTIASATDTSDLVLLKSAEKISLSNTDAKKTVTVAGKTYTVELISSSDTSATVKVTDSNGASETKEINENASKKVQGLTVAVTNADETNLQLSASIIAGAEKVTLTSGSSITSGENNDVVDGTKATFTGGTDAMTKLVVSVAAKNSDNDAIQAGKNFVDPVFGSFKIDFPSLNIPQNSSMREDISIKSTGDDRVEITFTDGKGNEKSLQWAKNTTSKLYLMHDSDERNISVSEMAPIYRNGMVVVGNEAEGYLLKASTITNQTTGYSSDKVKFTDVMSGDTYEATLTDEGTGTVTIGGKVYDVTYNGASDSSEDSRYVRLNYPDSGGVGSIVVYPTIQTSKGAKLAFYQPVTLNTSNWEGQTGANITQIRFPDGDGYTDITVSTNASGAVTFNSVALDDDAESANATIGKLIYNAKFEGNSNITIQLLNPEDSTVISNPAVVIFEERDDNSEYHAVITTLEPGATSDDGVGVDDVIRTWGSDNIWEDITLASNSKISKEADLWGTVTTLNADDSDQKRAIISYPDEQVYANLYVGSISSGVADDDGVVNTGIPQLTDSQVATQAAGKNLIVVGGSCINTVAARLLGSSSPLCGADFTAAAQTKVGRAVGPGSYLIAAFESPYSANKTAMLVAGWEAQDTVNAASYLTTNVENVSTAKGDAIVNGAKVTISG